MEADEELDPRIERTRRIVLEATAGLIGECGITGTTIEAVSDRSGVARSTIYRHWPQREHLVIEAIKSKVGPLHHVDTGDLRADLVTVLTGLGRMLTSEPMGSLAAWLIVEARRDPDLAAMHAKFTASRRGSVVAMIERGIARGELPADTDAHALAHDLGAMVFYRAFVTREPVDAEFIEGHVDRWLDHCRSGGG